MLFNYVLRSCTFKLVYCIWDKEGITQNLRIKWESENAVEAFDRLAISLIAGIKKAGGYSRKNEVNNIRAWKLKIKRRRRIQIATVI